MEKETFNNRFIAARRKIISGDFSGLNDMQQTAVMATEGPLLLLAGAGSGKTTVLINRIANLIRYGRGSDTDEVPEWAGEQELRLLEEAADRKALVDDRIRSLCEVDPVEPWRILAITFTNKAANELKTRLRNTLGGRAEDIWAMTFHSACVRILRRYIGILGYSSSFTIYDTSDSTSAMKRVLKEINLDEKTFQPKMVLGYISRLKDDMKDPDEFMTEAEASHNPRQKGIARAYKEYSRHLKEADALDFDDLIFMTVKLLEENDEVREYYQEHFRYVLVDEYQDTSKLQYKLVSCLAGGKNNICVVGDDDQSIYRFRGATIENILSFESSFSNARLIKLEQNYRSTAHILEAANAVISNNVGRKGKNLWTVMEKGDKPKFYIADNDNEEAQYVAAQIIYGVSTGMKWNDFAVLYRMNAQSNRLEYAFKRNNIPYKVVGGMKFFERAEIKDITSYLSVVMNPEDDLRLMRIINNPPRGIGQTALENIRAAAQSAGCAMIEIMRNVGQYQELGRSAGKITAFCEMMEDLRRQSDEMDLDEFYDELLERTGYLASLGDNDEGQARKENIKELKSNILEFMSRTENPTLSGFLDEIALFTDIDSVDENDSSVVMMTIHSAKGLEFPWVFVVGMEEGIFPTGRSSENAEDLEEERRLCYVAMTRAKKKLIMTAARNRMLFGHTTSNEISRFISEIPDEHLESLNRSRRFIDRNETGYSSDSNAGYNNEYWGTTGQAERKSNLKNRRSYQDDYEHVHSEWKHEKKQPGPNEKRKSASIDIKDGDRIEHKSFGKGTIKQISETAGDSLVTIEFDTGETKRFMLSTAGKFMVKL